MVEKTAAQWLSRRIDIDKRLEEIRQRLGPVMREASEPLPPELTHDELTHLEREKAALEEEREGVVFKFDVANELELGLLRAEELRRQLEGEGDAR